MFSGTPPSAQPSTGFKKKGNKGKKALHQQQRGVPWPPRPSGVSTDVIAPSFNVETGFKKPSPLQMASPPIISEDDRSVQAPLESVIKLELQHEAHGQGENSVSYLLS